MGGNLSCPLQQGNRGQDAQHFRLSGAHIPLNSGQEDERGRAMLGKWWLPSTFAALGVEGEVPEKSS